MAILWCGGEDIDFVKVLNATTTTTASTFRAGYGRCALNSSDASSYWTKSLGTQITQGWFSTQLWRTNSSTVCRALALCSGGSERLGIRLNGTTATYNVVKYDGATETVLGAAAALPASALYRVDMHVNYAVAGFIRVYINGALSVEFVGDVTAGGSTYIDSLLVGRVYACSEVIVADEDTRLLSLVTLAPNAAGDANAWAGTHVAIDETAVEDGDLVYTDTADRDALCALSDLPAGAHSVKAVKVAARAAKGATGIGAMAVGYKIGRLRAGLTSLAGGSNANSANTKYLRKLQIPAAGLAATGIAVLFKGTNATVKARCMVYADSAGAPGALIAVTGEVVGVAADEVREFPFAAPALLAGSGYYWLGIIADQNVSVGYTASAGEGRYNADTYADGPNDPAGVCSNTNALPCVDALVGDPTAVNVGSTAALTTAWATVERLLPQNPDTEATWQPAEINALQIVLRSKA